MEKLEYKGWPNCYRLSNQSVDLIVTTDVGPRIIRFGFAGEENELKVYEQMLGRTGGEEWRIYGGHRLWHAPEAKPRTYFPDNSPVHLEEHSGLVRVIQPPEATTRIQKELDISLYAHEAHVVITHRLRNANLWEVELAPWALTALTPRGKLIIPLPPRGSFEDHLRPTGAIVLWAYTDMADPRWTWGNRYVMLRQDPSMKLPQKSGFMVSDGWAAYVRDGHCFVKKFDYKQSARYPDYGCSVETFTDSEMLELETLAPLTRLRPGAAVEHVEHWFLFRDVPESTDDAEVDRLLMSRIRAATIP